MIGAFTPRSWESIKSDVVRDLAATVDVLEMAKDALIESDIQESLRLFRIVQGDLTRYETLIRLNYGKNKE
ncbi:hypothetical protein [Rodentibacter sp. Ppn85]|uniref:hypothetical protein n=1 Tax=Rodentibacter sp. Ppn85 TaxID=1908525 RepID=UPI000984665B|nr:hypothetical protein [Rodentibacter sp. Ppn85]OOF65158.1 hypothetical protein BKL51_06300 [Rodentibacter sp. Ppn85]